MKDISLRLKRVQGQIAGIAKMIDEKQDCEKVIIQFQAAKEALNSAFSELLNQSLEQCLNQKNYKNIKKIIKLMAKK